MNRQLLMFVALLSCAACSPPVAVQVPDHVPECGNGEVEEGEACDDGNVISGDGCSATCVVEVPAPSCGDGKLDDDEECDDGNLDSGDGCSATCVVEVPAPDCGDGELDEGEECDDGGVEPGDGCSATCVIEIPAPYCGDGELDDDEECDDGGVEPGDGCSATCVVEIPDPDPECSNGVVEEGEECDDGNLNAGDGCSPTCVVEVPAPYCGDGEIDDGEECDDGNEDDTDSCTNACFIAVCGDGYVQAGEMCDDGNEDDDDGCTNACLGRYRFTSAATVGRQGPSQDAVDTAYAGSSLASAVTVTETGIQRWVVPASGTYRIAAQGAAGFYGTVSDSTGASVAGDFDLVAGDALYVLVGQRGGVRLGGTHYYDAPGGGGTFVALGETLQTTSPLLVAGGGGGVHPTKAALAPGTSCGNTDTAGRVGYPSVVGGVNGSFGGAVSGTGQAAGFYSGPGESTASAFQDGGLGVQASRGSPGGFGGGGATEVNSAFLDSSSSGGGGGYSGGGAGAMGSQYSVPAGGGGSYNAGRNPVNVACADNEDGFVSITALSQAAADTTAPTPGADVHVSATTGTSVTLSWGQATDDVTASGDLQYKVVYATSDTLGGLDDALANGTSALEWSTSASSSFTVSRLSGATTYFFAVLVRDARGNVAKYGPSSLSATTRPVRVFTNAGATGRQGPDQEAVDAAYAGTNLASSVTVTDTGIQKWTVPHTGTYRIQARGAQGGTNHVRFSRGAAMRGTFSLNAGDTLWILVGQSGAGTPGNYAQVSGGGGSFIARGAELVSSIPLLVAGGGGGRGVRDPFELDIVNNPDPDAGSAATSGNAGAGNVAGGTNGSRGGSVSDATDRTDAAAGFFAGEGGQSSRAFQDGGLGADGKAIGGFGGGGAPLTNFYALSGGGGGYSGGGSSKAVNGLNFHGGGGGSFNAGTDPHNEASANTGHGKVVITEL